jgi:hypothetical protein
MQNQLHKSRRKITKQKNTNCAIVFYKHKNAMLLTATKRNLNKPQVVPLENGHLISCIPKSNNLIQTFHLILETLNIF